MPPTSHYQDDNFAPEKVDSPSGDGIQSEKAPPPDHQELGQCRCCNNHRFQVFQIRPSGNDPGTKRLKVIRLLAILSFVSYLLLTAYEYRSDIYKRLVAWPKPSTTPRFSFDPSPRDCISTANWTTFPTDEGNPQLVLSVTSHTSFDLPISAANTLVAGRGYLTHGSLQISDDGEVGSDKMVVEIKAMYDQPGLLDDFTVCAIKRKGDTQGVGIFTWDESEAPPVLPRTHFDVKIRLPKSSDGTIRSLNSLETDLPTFVHQVGDLQQSFDFDMVTLSAPKSPIHVESIYGKYVFAHASNNPITGKFNATRQIRLANYNGAIDAEISMENSGYESSSVSLETFNDYVKSEISLFTYSKENIGGSFQVLVMSQNAPLQITFPTAPIKSSLYFNAQTSNSPIQATLPLSYEGSFTLRSNELPEPLKHNVEYQTEVEDPSGLGRVREVEVEEISKGRIDGKVSWVGIVDASGPHDGGVGLSTSNAPITVNL